MEYFSMNRVQTLSVASLINDIGVEHVQFSRRNTSDEPDPYGFLVVSIVYRNRPQQRFAIDNNSGMICPHPGE